MGYVWLCPKPAAPSGGVQFINRWAYLLDSMGVESSILKTKPFEIWWDDTKPKAREVSLARGGDTVIIPEGLWNDWGPVFPSQRKICLMQNWQWMDARLDWKDVETICCSRYLSNYAKREFGMNVLGIVRPYLDEPAPEAERIEKSVMIMERRNGISKVLYDKFSDLGFTVHYVASSMTRSDLYKIIGQCEYYVHSVTPEGFPMICLEAMRYKTLVVGTSGGGGNEFMFDGLNCIVTQDPVHGYITEDEFVDQIVDGVVQLANGPVEKRDDMVQKAYDWSLRYTSEATMAELAKVFKC